MPSRMALVKVRPGKKGISADTMIRSMSPMCISFAAPLPRNAVRNPLSSEIIGAEDCTGSSEQASLASPAHTPAAANSIPPPPNISAKKAAEPAANATPAHRDTSRMRSICSSSRSAAARSSRPSHSARDSSFTRARRVRSTVRVFTRPMREQDCPLCRSVSVMVMPVVKAMTSVS